MNTYRSELDKLDTYFENGKLHHSMLSVQIYKMLFWIKKFLGKKDGYIDWMSRDYNCQVMTDIIQVLNIIVEDTIDLMESQLAKPQFEKFSQLKFISKLIIENFDKPIRSNPHIIYEEDENPDLNCNLLDVLEELLPIDNYLEEELINS